PKRRQVPALEQKLLTDAKRPRARFLCDNLERSAGWFDSKKPVREKRATSSLNFFKNLLHECAIACPGEAAKVQPVVKFLDNATAVTALHAQLAEAKAKPNELATYSVAGDWLLDLSGAAEFWRGWRKKLNAGQVAKERVCLATGERVETVNTTGIIKGIPGGNPSGTIFLSFDKDSFCSYGLEQAQNAALSVAAELKIRSALNSLIEKSRAQGLRFNDTICLHWTREPIKDDPIDLLASADENAVAALLNSFQSGQQPVAVDANNYYAMSLSGNGARIIVRDWLESTVPEIRDRVALWFHQLGIAAPTGVNVKHEFSLGQLLWALANPKLDNPFDALPHGTPDDLLRAALTGGPLPQSILMAALRRETVDRVSGGDEAGQRKPFLTSRFALIKLCLLRSPNRKDYYT
ncbi:MAG: type I-C CRISPR-associated protein Cas8c/Csd1, partial [Limisphaerales bacterium]